MDRIRERLAANMRRLRAERGISQERLALEAGVDRTMLSKIERKISNPSMETLLKLANRLGVDLVVLLEPVLDDPSAADVRYLPQGASPETPLLALHEPQPDVPR